MAGAIPSGFSADALSRRRTKIIAVATFFLTLTGATTVQRSFWLYAGFGVAAVVESGEVRSG
jgi:hypothetical protein